MPIFLACLSFLLVSLALPAFAEKTPDPRPPDVSTHDKTKRPLPPKIAKVVEGLQRFYSAIKDFSAAFEQTFTRVKLQRETKEHGTFFFLRPGKMRFQYKPPERKAFIYNGKTLWMYNQDDEEVKVQKNVSRNDLGIAFRFLWGSVQLHDDFEIQEKKPFPFGQTGDICLELKPRTPQTLFQTLYFAVDPATYQIRETIYLDMAGNRNHFRFSKMRINRGLKPSLFEFKIPKGIQVIELR